VETNVSIDNMKVKKPSLFGMITSPSVQFERMKDKPPIALPLILMLLLMGILGAGSAYIDLKNPIYQDTEMMVDFEVPLGVTLGMGAGVTLIGGAIAIFISAAFYKVCMVILGNDTTYRKLLGVVVYSGIISVLGLFVNLIIALATGGYEPNYTSLAPLVTDKTAHAIAANFEIFNIWYYVVMVLGLNIVAGLGKNKAVVLVVIVFLLGVGISSLSGFLPGP
jgi:hypothetical protein